MSVHNFAFNEIKLKKSILLNYRNKRAMAFQISGREEILIPSVFEFYSNKKHMEIFNEIVVKGEYISLRLFDYFATNYSKQNKVHIDKTGTDIYTAYKQNLKGYKKEYFDPFCRRKRIALRGKNFNISELNNVEKYKKLLFTFTELKSENELSKKNNDNADIIITTIGQLNFFKWCIQSDIIPYILKHSKKIEQLMSSKKPKNDKPKLPEGGDRGVSKKTSSEDLITKNNNQGVYKTRMNFTLKFTN